MSLQDERVVRFGLRRGDQRSGTYVVAGSSRSDDVYITSRHIGSQFKVSLHASGSWRMSVEPIHPETGKVGAPIGGETWARPAPFSPGLTKVFSVMIAGGAIGSPLTPDVVGRVRLYTVPHGAQGVQFTIIYALSNVFMTSWPGANGMRSTIVGRFALPGGKEDVFVVAHALEELPTVKAVTNTSGPLPGFTADDLRSTIEEGTARGIAFGSDDADGSRWFMDFRAVAGPSPTVDLAGR